MLLENKIAVIYGAGGSLGGALSKSFAKEGARVFVTGKNLGSIQKLAEEINDSGGRADAAVVDAMDERAVNDHLDAVAKVCGSVDISFNVIDLQVVQGMQLVDMKMEEFVRPVRIAMETQFLTGTAAARIMIKQGSGVILTLTATPAAVAYPGVGGFGAAGSAMERFSQQLACEIGKYGVRVVNIRSAGSPDSRVFKKAIEDSPAVMEAVLQKMKADTMLKDLPLLEDISNTAVFLTSHLSGKITGVTIDVTAGSIGAFGYRS